MQINCESCVFVEDDDMVYGEQGYAYTSQWHETAYYSYPLEVFDSDADVPYPNGDVYTYNSTYYQDPNLSDEYNCYGAPQSSSFSGGYLFYNQDVSYDFGAYHYQYYPVYYVYPTYLDYYPLTNLQYSPTNFYYTYVYVPVNIYYYVPHLVYTASTNNVNDVIYDVDSTQSYESDVMLSSLDHSFENSQEFNSNFYNIRNSSKEIIGEEQTTFHLVYEEYPEMLNEAPADDKKKSECSNKKLEKDIVSNGAEVNECIAVDDQSYSIETNLCEDDVDIKLIKKISSLSIDEVKEDIDENYENAKAFLYNEVLKGYTEIKSQLEELDWECHSLEDILEEEEPESDSSEMDFSENVAEDLHNINLLPVEEEEYSSAFESSSEESEVASSEEPLDKDYETMMEEAQPSADLSVAQEKDKTDPVIVLYSSEESKVASSEEALDKDYEIMMEEAQPSLDISVVPEKDKTDPVIVLYSSEESKVASSEEALDKDYEIMMIEAEPSVDPSIDEEKDKNDPVLELSSSEEKNCRGSLNAIEEHNPLVDPTAVEGKDKIGPFLDQALSKKELYTGSHNTNEDDCKPGNSSAVEENYKMDSVPELSLRPEKSNSGSRCSIKEPDTRMASEDRVEEKLNFDPDLVAPAASKAYTGCKGPASKCKGPFNLKILVNGESYSYASEIPRKKRFSGLRKFFARMCCCVKKTS